MTTSGWRSLPHASLLDFGRLVAELDRREIGIANVGGRLRLRYPEGALDEATRREIASRRDEILPILEHVERVEPAAFAQERLWAMERTADLGGAFVIGGAARFESGLDGARLAEAWSRVTKRHGALRTAVAELDGAVRQIVLQHGEAMAHARHADLVAAIRAAEDDVTRPFTFDAPLARATLHRIDGPGCVVAIAMHHIVSDAPSLRVVWRDLLGFYDGTLDDAAEPAQFWRFAVRERAVETGDRLQRMSEFWTNHLRDATPDCILPWDRPRPAVQSFEGASLGIALDQELSDGFRALCRTVGATPYTVFLAAFQILLARWSSQPSVCVGIPVGLRDETELADAVGYLVNTVVSCGRPSARESFATFVRRVQTDQAASFDHRTMPLELLARNLRRPRSLDRHPLFQVMFVHHAAREDARALRCAGARLLRWPARFAQCDLHLTTREEDGRFHLSWEYATALFDRETVERLSEGLTALLGEAAARPEAPVGSLAVMPERERRRVVEAFNATRDETIETAVRVDDLVLAQARRSPAATAVRCGTRSLAYAELEEAAQALAVRLSRAGVGRGAVVGVCLERCLELPAALLGILRAGAAYLPLDPELPPERLRFMARDAGCAAVVTTRALSGTAPEEGARLLLDEPESDPRAPRPADAGGGPLDPAYVIYTSGSTGRPKGVVVPHAGVVNRLVWMQRQYGLGPHDRVLQKTPLGFDVSVWELFAPLIAGAELVMARPGGHRDPGYLAEEIARSGVTVLHFVPSMLRQYAATAPARDGVRLVVASGEALGADQPAAAARCFPNAAVHNLYGPTEASVDVSWWACDPAATDPVPIGRPIANMRLYVLDAGGEPCPVGVVGELHIAGVGLAQGYLGRPGQTAERFLPDPFGPPGGRLYRTGDLARWRRDGALDYLGRNDDQVKIRGHRIELGEVEAALAAAPGVRAAAVAARPDPAGATRLVGYLVGETGAAALDRDAVRDHLRTRLPPAMIPPILHPVDALPLTPNGKLDRNALPEPDDEPTHGAAACEPPLGPVEDTLAAIWRDILQTDRIGRHDDFFARGGDSILALMIVSRAHAAGIALAPRMVFENPTIAALAQAAAAETPATAPGSEQATSRWLPAQRWFLSLPLAERDHWNHSVLLAPRSPLDADAFRRAVTVLVGRHEALRTGCLDGGTPVALSEDRIPALAAVAFLDGEDQLQGFIDAVNRELDLGAGLVFRATLIDLGGAGQRVSLVAHHFAVDVVSWNVLVGELDALLGGGSAAPSAADATAAYLRRLEDWVAGGGSEAARRYWSAFAAQGCPALPRDHENGRNCEGDAASIRLVLPSAQAARLAALGARRFEALQLASLAEALTRWAAAPAIVVMREGQGRTDDLIDVDLSATVGWFTSFLPVRLTPLALADAVPAAQAMLLQLEEAPGGAAGYGALRYLDADCARFAVEPEVGFNYLGRRAAAVDAGRVFDLSTQPDLRTRSCVNRRAFLLEVVTHLDEEGLHVALVYSAAIHERRSMADLATAVLNGLARFADSVGELPARPPGPSAGPLPPHLSDRRLSRRLRSEG
ncbi:amino acid adenylation domain-containing protein [Salinarimonas sp.]|uniref:amino acid adenylation domain-containing protein n=1 Tax=Salinarimonas sp. TaxID=2766526 RepID=UPI0032D8D927